MNSASNGWSGTGPFDALVFGKPTWLHIHVRRTCIIASAKFVRLLLGLSKPKIKQLGVDVAGQVEAVGGNVTNSSTPKTRVGWFRTSGTELDACPLAHWESFRAFGWWSGSRARTFES